MTRAIKVLLQTTIPSRADDWSIGRFGQLAELLRAQRDREDHATFEVIARDRDPLGAPDAVLCNLDQSDFDQLWLFAVELGTGLRQKTAVQLADSVGGEGAWMVTRDHMDLGSSICSLAGVGDAHHFHTRNIDPNASERDDPYSTNISWPNFHSGSNGDYQTIQVVPPAHPVLENPSSPTGLIRYLPSHPHEGAVSAPAGHHARVIASAVSKITGRPFNIAVAFEAYEGNGRAIAQSTFHHFADYNWDPRSGAPSFVDEPPGNAILLEPDALADTAVMCAT